MYCSSCGTEVTKELNYCNRCGAKLGAQPAGPEAPARVVNINGPFWAMAFMSMVWLIATFASVADLAKRDVSPLALTWMVIGSLGALVGVLAIFMQFLSRMGGLQRKAERPSRRKAAEAEQQPAQLPPMRFEPVPSVTEHTTRTFEAAAKRKGWRQEESE